MKALIVEDDLALADVISFTLRREGFEVAAAYDGLAALDRWEAERPDLVILDLNLPKLDGLAVCEHIRSQAQTPIIILSVRGEDDDVVRGLQLGADDYIAKPFSPRQLVARAQAVLRRAGVPTARGPLTSAGAVLDVARRELRTPGQEPVQLTALECRLLETLMLNSGQVVPVETLIASVWGPEGADRAMLKQLIYRLRRKIEADPSTPTYLETVPGVGYAFAGDSSPRLQ
jgi:DNA-binding response OmpR family regulator